MSLIHIRREHRLPRDRVKEQINGLAEELKARLEADYAWQDDTLTFKRTGASGRIVVEDREVDVQIKLGMLLKPFRSTVEQAICDYLDEHLA